MHQPPFPRASSLPSSRPRPHPHLSDMHIVPAWSLDSPEELVSPPDGLILSALLPGAHWPLQEGPWGALATLHLSNCASNIPQQSTTRQGIWREWKFQQKSSDYWERERKSLPNLRNKGALRLQRLP